MKIFIAKLSECITRIDSNLILSKIDSWKKERICSLRKDEDFERKLLGEMLIRDILVKEYDVSENAIVFSCNRYGKPYLLSEKSIHFNMSSSDDYVACAVGSEEVGIDIEHIMPIDPLVAEYFFSAEEINTLKGYEGHRKLEYFYGVWTIKESYVKALGKGIDLGLERYTVRQIGENIRLFEGNEELNYNFNRYMLGNDYVMAVCSFNPVEGIIPEIRKL
jgi:4'-phosphopantetheinyl transferase